MTPGRGVGAAGAIAGALPEWAVPALVALTQLGDVWFCVGAVSLVYWFHDRRRGALALAAVLGAAALTVGLKALFALPRPPHATIAVDGHGFPSGHAIVATVAWGSLARAVDVGAPRRRRAVAAAAVATVGFTRVALGVHYAADVVAGVLVGAAYLAGVTRYARGDPARGGLAASAVALAAALATGGRPDAAALLGGTVAVPVAWHTLDIPAAPWGREGIAPALAAGALALAGAALVETIPAIRPLALAVGGAVIAVAVGLPAVVEVDD